MPQSVELVLGIDQADDPLAQRADAAGRLAVLDEQIAGLRVRKRSLDARHEPIRVRLQADVYVDEPVPNEPPPVPSYRSVEGARSVVVVGSGPAGLFAALRLIELGLRPIVLDRGKDAQARRHDLAALQRFGTVDPDSNYCFGEGGAGTYSDGKLYTRATKRGSVDAVLRTLVAHGAKPEIRIDAHPHIGSNKLPKVVQAIRRSILDAGGEVRFETKVVDLLRDASGQLHGVVTASGDEVTGEAVVLATGHSARDIFDLLHRRGVAIEAKPFAMGVRIEHPQQLIDELQYHRQGPRDGRLPAASYRLAATVDGRGVFSFCMCPGGWIVPAATAPGETVVNGMSLSRRDSPFANSGLVVSVEPADWAPFAHLGPLAGLEYQRTVEQTARAAAGEGQRAPAQRVADFLARRESTSLPETSYRPGLTSAPLTDVLPDGIARRLAGGLRQFGKQMPGYASGDAVLIGVESRTSSPVRIPRDGATLEHPTLAGLYPCGEGAGYAGGIVSAALDGMRVAEAVAAQVRSA